MATWKQKHLVKAIVKNNGNLRKSMKEVGYSDSVSKRPKTITETKGFKEAAAKQGLTEDLITESLVDDIIAKPANRKGELELGAKILGLTDKKEVSGDITIKWEE
jgi:hypothetical protein